MSKVGLLSAVLLAAAATPGLTATQGLPVGDLLRQPSAVVERMVAAEAGSVETRGLVVASGETPVVGLVAPYGCRFEGSDGRAASGLWIGYAADGARLVAPMVLFERPSDEKRMARLRPPSQPVFAAQHGELPLADGLDGLMSRLGRAAWTPSDRLMVRCVTRRTTEWPEPTVANAIALAPVKALSVIVFAPVTLFAIPSENAARARAAAEGPRIADSLTPGELLPGGLKNFQARHAPFVRLFEAEGADYAVITVDLGGPAIDGIAQPRDAAFFGVRNGVVEWRADRGMGVETALCARADGRFGGRTGCTVTGYYGP